MAEALKAKDDPVHVARITDATRTVTRELTFDRKTFEDLTTAEKDKLLKVLAVRAGLLPNSADS